METYGREAPYDAAVLCRSTFGMATIATGGFSGAIGGTALAAADLAAAALI